MKVLIRLDLNVPIKDGKVKDSARISNYTNYINKLVAKGDKICIITHLGRPKNKDPELSTQNLLTELETIWNINVKFLDSYETNEIKNQLDKLEDKTILLLENSRYFSFEKSNDLKQAKKIAQCFDKFIFDAFSTAHRKHLSTNGITKFLPSTLGETCKNEIKNLKQALDSKNPLIIMGGAKAQTKLELIETFLNSASHILVGGVLANTFLKAQGFKIQKSKYEPELVKFCKSLLQSSNSHKIILPFDFTVGETLQTSQTRNTEILKENELIGDIGPKTTAKFTSLIKESNTVIFNGPMGYTENTLFKESSVQILNAISNVNESFLGGGDTLKLMTLANKKTSQFTFVSMAGGAMLEFLAKNGELEVINEIENR